LPQLPNSLKKLNCSHNQILGSLFSLLKLPKSLKELKCWNNQLSVLPVLPNSLKILCCDNNTLIKKIKYRYLIKIICL